MFPKLGSYYWPFRIPFAFSVALGSNPAFVVYTRAAPRAPPTPAFAPSQSLTPLAESVQELGTVGTANTPTITDNIVPSSRSSSTPLKSETETTTLSLAAGKPELSTTPGLANNVSPGPSLAQLNNPSQDSQVLNETLNVINEHITHLRSPPSTSVLHAAATDSGSEYSAPLDHRMSYIQGEETDEEEEDAIHTRAEVESWNPDQVAEYLFESGVEKHHCEVFRDQEISGEVLLGMDQSSLFIKAFDLGSVGRRLKTWHKIKALQDDISTQGLSTRRTTQTYGSEAGSEDARRTRSRTSTLTTSASNRPLSNHARRLSMTQGPKASPTAIISPPSPRISRNLQDSSSRSAHTKRPSAASVRELHHSRRHSSTDFRAPGALPNATTPKLSPTASLPVGEGAHKKQPSFDRNWTLGSALSSQTSQRPLSSTGLQDGLAVADTDLQDSAVDLDRGYFSGTEVDGRKRNVLRKRDSADHSRKQSYTEEQRVRSATALSRHSRFGSVDSFRDGVPSSAAHKYYGIQTAAHRRTASTNTTDSARPLPPSKDGPAPTVTKLDSPASPAQQLLSPVAAKPQGFNTEWLAAVVNKPMSKSPRPGMRAISDKLTFERSKAITPAEPSPKEPSLDSPARTGSTTPSAGPSFELDSADARKSASSASTPISKSSRKKGKKGTSAYTRGLLKITPQEAMKDADYYGWMRKKSSNLMTTWKPRLFVLKGRRMAYYYSEEDEEERGLIDISFHRVLPADNERLTGLHATITGAGAVGGSGIPANHPSTTVGGDMSETLEKGDDIMFIFKLVPPRAGLSRAVNFTKPTVHYFAVPNLKQGRLWMAALMKATIDRDDTQPVTTTYQQKTISLAKAKQMRHRPPALMNLEEAAEDGQKPDGTKNTNSLGIYGDSGVSGVDKTVTPRVASARLNADYPEKNGSIQPLSA